MKLSIISISLLACTAIAAPVPAINEKVDDVDYSKPSPTGWYGTLPDLVPYVRDGKTYYWSRQVMWGHLLKDLHKGRQVGW